jgi:hypothetical protein
MRSAQVKINTVERDETISQKKKVLEMHFAASRYLVRKLAASEMYQFIILTLFVHNVLFVLGSSFFLLMHLAILLVSFYIHLQYQTFFVPRTACGINYIAQCGT